MPGIEVVTPEPSTNMVYFRVSAIAPEKFEQKCVEKGFRFSEMGDRLFRAVTHIDISTSDIDQVVQGMKSITA